MTKRDELFPTYGIDTCHAEIIYKQPFLENASKFKKQFLEAFFFFFAENSVSHCLIPQFQEKFFIQKICSHWQSISQTFSRQLHHRQIKALQRYFNSIQVMRVTVQQTFRDSFSAPLDFQSFDTNDMKSYARLKLFQTLLSWTTSLAPQHSHAILHSIKFIIQVSEQNVAQFFSTTKSFHCAEVANTLIFPEVPLNNG